MAATFGARFPFIFATLSLPVAVACGDDVAPVGGGGSGAAGAQAPQGGEGAGSEGGGGNRQGGGGSPGGGGAGQGGQGESGGEGGGSSLCGGLAEVQCRPAEFCDFANDFCGGDDSQGECQPRPKKCPDLAEPSCGCDGTIYANFCEGNSAGVDVSVGGCQAPAGDFQCGSQFCGIASEACFQTPNDVAEPPPVFYSCGDLPPACDLVAVPSCVCAASAAVSCGGSCEDVPSGGVIIHCPGG